jgi:hypothetical protein
MVGRGMVSAPQILMEETTVRKILEKIIVFQGAYDAPSLHVLFSRASKSQ